MEQFNEQFKTDNETLYLSFNRIYTGDGEKFYVVVQKGRHFFPFHMRKDDAGNWKIAEPAPEWAKGLEARLSEIIDRNI